MKYKKNLNISLPDKINIVMAFLTFLSVSGVYFTLHEMKIQRNTTYNPSIVMNPVEVYFEWDKDGQEDWFISMKKEEISTSEIMEDDSMAGNLSIPIIGLTHTFTEYAVTNIGVGTAKNVMFKWQESNKQKLYDYLIACNPDKEEFCTIGKASDSFWIGDHLVIVDKEQPMQLMYMLSDKEEMYSLYFPAQYTLLIHEAIKYGYMNGDKNPYLTLFVSYQDIQGNTKSDVILILIKRIFYKVNEDGSGNATYQLVPALPTEVKEMVTSYHEEKTKVNLKDIIEIGSNIILSILSIILAYKVYTLNQKDYLPKLAVRANQKNVGTAFDARVNEKISEFDFEQDGFPVDEERHRHILWEIIIQNNSDVLATNIKLNYQIVIKKMQFSYGIDEADIIDPHLVEFAAVDDTFSCEYLPPRGEARVKVLYLTGKFPEADLFITSFQCTEDSMITNKVKIDTYEHIGFKQIEDSPHMRRLYGAGKSKTKNDV